MPGPYKGELWQGRKTAPKFRESRQITGGKTAGATGAFMKSRGPAAHPNRPRKAMVCPYWIGSRTVLLTTLLTVTVSWKSPPEGAPLASANSTTSMPTAPGKA